MTIPFQVVKHHVPAALAVRALLQKAASKYKSPLCLVFLIVLCRLVSIAPAATYYVDSATGNDAAGGTDPNTPWRTLTRVNSQTFAPGDKILFKARSRYTGKLLPHGSGAEGQPIVIDMYGGESKPRIDAKGAYAAVELNNVQHWEVNNLELTNNRSGTGKYKGIAVKIDNIGKARHIHLKNLYIHDVNGYYNLKNYTMGIYINNEGSGSHNTHFDDLLIENCRIVRTDRDGIVVKSDKGGTILNQNVVIRNNTIEDVAGDGIVIWDCDGAIIEGTYLNGARMRVSDRAAGIWPYRCVNTVIQGNEVCNIKGTLDGQSFDSDRHCHNTTFQYNYSHDNDGGFLLIMGDDNSNNIVRYNISQNDGARIFQFGGPTRDNKIYNNTIYTRRGMTVLAVQLAYYRGDHPINTHFYNNIFYADGRFTYLTEGSHNTIFENNIFYGNNSPRPSDPRVITSDPLLLDPGAGRTGRDSLRGYMLRPNSPAIRSGKTIPNNGGRDFWGNIVPAATPCTRGAYESSTSVDYNGDGIVNFLDFSTFIDTPQFTPLK